MAKKAAVEQSDPKVGFWKSGFPNQLGNLSLIAFILLVIQLATLMVGEVNIFDPDDFRSTDERIPALGTRRVVDEAGVLNSGEIDALTGQIDAFEDASHGQMAVLLIKSLHGDSIEDFGLAVAEKWKIGHKGQDNGVVLVLAMEDHRSRLEVGYGYEGVINDARAGDVLRGMAPAMRAGQYAAAISGAISDVSKMVLAENAPDAPEGLRFDPDTAADDDEIEETPIYYTTAQNDPMDLWLGVFFSFIVFIAVAMLTAVILIHPDVKKSIGLVVMIVVIRVLFQILLAALRSGGRSSGGGGGGGRSRSGGGGGSFGGGGASGRW